MCLDLFIFPIFLTVVGSGQPLKISFYYIPPLNLVGTCLCFLLCQRFLVCFWFGFEFDVNLNFVGFLHSGLYFRFMLSMQSFMISWKLVKLVLYLLYPG